MKITRKLVLQLVYFALSLALALYLLWQLYQTLYLFVTVIIAIAGAFGVFKLTEIVKDILNKKFIDRVQYGADPKKAPFYAVFPILVILGYIILIVPAALPSIINAPLQTLLRIFTAPFSSWKELASISPPVGTFNGLLVPCFIVYYLSTLCILFVTKKLAKSNTLVTFFVSIPLVFAIAFAIIARSSSANIFGITVLYPDEFIIGGLFIIVTIIYLTLLETFSVVIKADTKAKTHGQSFIYKTWFGCIVLVIVTVLAVVISPLISAQNFANLRVAPKAANPPATSQLDQFRSYFNLDTDTIGDNRNTKLLTISDVNGKRPDRIKFAAFSKYDLVRYSANSDYFQVSEKLPVNNSQSADSNSIEITLNDYNYKWLPVIQGTQSITFNDSNSFEESTNLFYSSVADSAFVDSAEMGLDNASYELTYSSTSDANDAAKGNFQQQESLITEDNAPSFTKWLENEEKKIPGNTLNDLRSTVDDLLYYSYLSRSLLNPNLDADGQETWLPSSDYIFAPSTTGQNISKIDTEIFGELLRDSPDCSRENRASACGLAVGDQEQFAVAASLIAQRKGFETRVAVGASIPENSNDILGSDLTAWIEVHLDDGSWVNLNVNPREDNHIPPKVLDSKPLEYTTVTNRDTLQYSGAPSASPQTNSNSTENNASPAVTDKTMRSILAVLQVVGLALLVVTLLFLLICGIPFAKFLRLRKLRRNPNTGVAVASSFASIVNCVRECTSLKIPAGATRIEMTNSISEQINGDSDLVSRINQFAVRMNEAEFSGHSLSAQDVTEYWKSADSFRHEIHQGLTTWQKLKAWESLAIFWK